MQQMTDDMQTYMKIAEAAQHWEISARRVQALCAEGKIDGAMRVGRTGFCRATRCAPWTGAPRRAERGR